MDNYSKLPLEKNFDKVHTRWIRFSKKCYSSDYKDIDHYELITNLEYEKLEETNIWVILKNNIFHVYISYSNVNFPDELLHQKCFDFYCIVNKVENIDSVADIVSKCFDKFRNPLWNKCYIHNYTNAISWDIVINCGKVSWRDYMEPEFSKITILKRLSEELFYIDNYIFDKKNNFKIEEDDKLLENINQLPYIARTTQKKYYILI